MFSFIPFLVYLKLSDKGEFVNTIYSSPLKFPSNLAFSKEVLGRMGFVSLVQIKEKFDGKELKCELKTAGQRSAENFIQNGKRINAEKIQINMGEKVIIISTTATSALLDNFVSNGVNIGTTSPTEKLNVEGNMQMNGNNVFDVNIIKTNSGNDLKLRNNNENSQIEIKDNGDIIIEASSGLKIYIK